MFDLEELNRRMVGRWGEVFSPYLRNVQARGDERRARCPFHDDRSPSFGFNVGNGLWICRAGCGSGNGFQFLERAGNVSFGEAVRDVAAMVGMDDEPRQAGERRQALPTVTISQPKPEPTARVGLAERLQEYQAALAGSPGETYLRKRGIHLALAQSMGLGYAAPGRWLGREGGGRVVFPHTNPAGDVVNLYGRAVGNVPNLKHDHLSGPKGMFNAPALLADKCYITEGPFDAISFMAAGYANTAAVFGVAGMRWEWLRARRVVFCLDADKAGQEAWRKLALEGYTRGYEVAFADPATYGGCKDANEAWVTHGRLSLDPGAPAQCEPITARGDGWKLIFSGTVDDHCVFADDEVAAARSPEGYVTYTAEELRTIGDGGLNAEGLKQIHAAKKLLGGRVGLKQGEQQKPS